MFQNLSLFLQLAILAVVVVASVLLTLRFVKAPPTKLASEIEDEAFKAVAAQLKFLSSHAADQKAIVIADGNIRAREARVAQFASEFAALLPTPPGPASQVPAATGQANA